LVLPFQTVDGRLGDQWIARSIQQSILSDLMTSGPMPVSTAPSPAADPADAGRRAGARYVIDSLIHLNPAEGETAIRVTGQVISTETGQPIAAVKATGTLDNLFALEDDLGAQFRRRLNQVIGKPTPPAAEAPPEIPFSGPVTSSPQQRYPWYDYGAPHNVPPDAMERYYYQVPFPNGFPYYDSGAAYPPYSYYPGNYGYPFFTSGVFFSHRNDHVHHQIGSGGRPIGPRGPTLPPNSGGHPRRR
jgi:TolB-like protein